MWTVWTVHYCIDDELEIICDRTGSILHSTTTPGDELRETVKKSGALLCADVDPSFTYLGVASSDKTVRVWDIRSLTVVSERYVCILSGALGVHA